MKKKYVSPEFDYEKIFFDNILSVINVSDSEYNAGSGNQNDGDDIGNYSNG